MTSNDDSFDLVLESGRSERNYWIDLWKYRGLFYFLAWKDMVVRYKQTVIGIAWAMARPLLTMLVFTFIFSKIARLPSGDVPYPILVFAAMLPWQFFSTGFSAAADSLVNNSGMISKVYFPRMIIPVSAVITSLADFLISFGLLVCIMAWYRFIPSWQFLLLPLFTGMAFAAAIGAGLWMAALNVKYRDFKIIVPFVVQFGLYISPVGFTSSIVPEQWRVLYALNPVVGIIDGFRWAIIGNADFPWLSVAISLVGITLVNLFGVWYFRQTEKTFADVI